MRSIKGYLFKRVGKPIFRRYIIYVGYIIHIDYIVYSHTLLSFAELSITPLFKYKIVLHLVPNSNFQIGATESTGPRLACSPIGRSLVGSSDAVPDMGLKNTEV